MLRSIFQHSASRRSVFHRTVSVHSIRRTTSSLTPTTIATAAFHSHNYRFNTAQEKTNSSTSTSTTQSYNTSLSSSTSASSSSSPETSKYRFTQPESDYFSSNSDSPFTLVEGETPKYERQESTPSNPSDADVHPNLLQHPEYTIVRDGPMPLNLESPLTAEEEQALNGGTCPNAAWRSTPSSEAWKRLPFPRPMPPVYIYRGYRADPELGDRKRRMLHIFTCILTASVGLWCVFYGKFDHPGSKGNHVFTDIQRWGREKRAILFADPAVAYQQEKLAAAVTATVTATGATQ